MTKFKVVLTGVLCLLFALAGCAKTATNPPAKRAVASSELPENKRIASVDVVKVDVQPTEIKGGSSGEATVRLTIQRGYHINANPPTYGYLKATELEISQDDGVSVSSIYYPSPLNKKFTFAEKPLAVYEGQTELKATLKAAKAAKTGERSISARLRVQACDDQVCYPPGILDLTIPVSIK